MGRFRQTLIGAACLMAAASLLSCRRSSEPGSAVGDDLKGVAQQAGKTAKDVGSATADLADRAGKRIEKATNEAGAGGDDAWITTKVKTELTTQGVDPLHVHVDTADKVVTLSGEVETKADVRKAVGLARAVKGVVAVQDHLFVKPIRR
jgi:hyperosmotically inducible protein